MTLAERKHGGLRAFTGRLHEVTAVGAVLPLILSGPSSSPLKYEAQGVLSPTQATKVVGNEHLDTAPITIKKDASTLIFTSPSHRQQQARNTNLCDPADLPTVIPDATTSRIFSNLEDPGIVAADAAHEVIVHGEKFIFFSDSLVGKVYQGHIDKLTGFIHNSALIDINGKWISDFGGTADKPESLLPDLSKHSFKWIDTPIAENGKILVFDSDFDDSNPFGHFEGQSAIEVFSTDLEGMPIHEETIKLPPDATTRWGTAVVSDPKGEYRYIYGDSSDPSSGKFFGMKIARAQIGNTTDVDSWQYWNGEEWTTGASHAALVKTDAVFSGITYSNGKYLAVSIPQSVFTDNHLNISCADSPQGPWTNPENVYTIPEITEYYDQVAYLPVVIPSTGEQISVLYSTNTTKGLSAIKENPARYRPVGVGLRP